MQAVPPARRTTLISCVYNFATYDGRPPGLGYVMLFDNDVLAWLIDDTGAGAPPQPVILGSLPPLVPPTMPIFSPQWAVRETWEWMVPDIARGTPSELFTFLATNNGAWRPIYQNFMDSGLIDDFRKWADAHPKLALKGVPL